MKREPVRGVYDDRNVGESRRQPSDEPPFGSMGVNKRVRILAEIIAQAPQPGETPRGANLGADHVKVDQAEPALADRGLEHGIGGENIDLPATRLRHLAEPQYDPAGAAKTGVACYVQQAHR